MSADLSARVTAAAAALADYRAAGLDMMGRALWADRLAAELGGVLAGMAADDTTADSARIAEVRSVLDAFDWETDDRQYALERIDRITEGSTR